MTTLITLLSLSAGATLGAVLRYYVSLWALERFGAGFPAGTLIVNLVGSLLLGFLLTLTARQEQSIVGSLMSPPLRLLLTTGLCGSLTTFSTFGYETVVLIGRGDYTAGVLNIAGSVLAGLLAVLLGIGLARLVP